MEFLRRKKFEIIVIEVVLRFIDKYYKNKKDLKEKEVVEAQIDLFFGRNPKISRVSAEIGHSIKIPNKKTELLIRTTLEFTYNNYKVDIDRKQKELLSLHYKLRVVQQKSRSGIVFVTKKESKGTNHIQKECKIRKIK